MCNLCDGICIKKESVHKINANKGGNKMMKRISGLIILSMMLLSGFYMETAHGETPQMEKRPVTHQVKLTTEQQKQIETLEQQILSKRKEVIEKYVQYGVLTKEQGTHITKRMDEHYNHLKNNGFVPLLKKPQHHRP